MANQKVTLTTPEGSLTKTTSERDLSVNETSFQGMRFYYNPSSNGEIQTLTFVSGNFAITKDLYIIDEDWKYKIVKRTEELSNGSIKEWWVIPTSGQEFDIGTMTCITKTPVLY